MRVVVDAGPVIHLSWIGRLDLLAQLLEEVLLPPAARDDALATAESQALTLAEESEADLVFTDDAAARAFARRRGLEPFARDLGYDGSPFVWDEDRRHRLKCELDAIFAHLYHLDRPDLEWILDAPYPSASFPGLKRNEMRQLGEYRTQRYVLQAYDQMVKGAAPDLAGV